MKILWAMALVWCATINLARGIDRVPAQSLCALGRIDRVEQTGPNLWLIEVKEVRMLFRSAELHDDLSTTTADNGPTNITLRLITGLGGVLVSPTTEWVGHSVLFSGRKNNGDFTVPNRPLPVSPNGASFAVFDSDEDPAIVSIEETARILKKTNTTVRLQHLVESVESSTVPTFLKRFSIQQIAQTEGKEPEHSSEIRSKLLEWRDGQRLAPELRLFVDDTLVNHSPRTYQWSKERLLFLRSLRDTPNLSPENANVVARRINVAEVLKSSGLPGVE
jgi:hypothetical protein